jgi:hypothetical protein
MRAFLLVLLVAAITAPATALASTPDPVSIAIDRGAAGDLWSASGAFSDSGTLSDAPQQFTRTGTYHVFRTYVGSEGTFQARADVKIIPTATPGVFSVLGHWTVIAGTGAYATLHGTGTLTESFDSNAGTVIGSWEGSVHFD